MQESQLGSNGQKTTRQDPKEQIAFWRTVQTSSTQQATQLIPITYHGIERSGVLSVGEDKAVDKEGRVWWCWNSSDLPWEQPLGKWSPGEQDRTAEEAQERFSEESVWDGGEQVSL